MTWAIAQVARPKRACPCLSGVRATSGDMSRGALTIRMDDVASPSAAERTQVCAGSGRCRPRQRRCPRGRSSARRARREQFVKHDAGERDLVMVHKLVDEVARRDVRRLFRRWRWLTYCGGSRRARRRWSCTATRRDTQRWRAPCVCRVGLFLEAYSACVGSTREICESIRQPLGLVERTILQAHGGPFFCLE